MTLKMANPLEAISYEDLYSRWEKGNWSATELDFTVDREDWQEKFTAHERRAALWNYAMFFHGEDSVAGNLSPYIDAAPREEQKYFLTTQQVDEARHAVFFNRFMHEVAGVGAGDVASSLSATQPELSWAFKRVFARLDKMADELRRDRSPVKFAQAIAMYHLIVEASLAQPGQHFIESYLEDRQVLPGFREGMRNVSLDEQRHIGFGVKVLAEMVAADPEVREGVIAFMREVVPDTAGVLVPPGWDETYITCLGSSMEELYAQGFVSIETKLRTIGFTDDEIRRALTTPLELSPLERAGRVIRMLRGGILGEKLGPPSKDPELMALFFDTLRHVVDHRHAPARPVDIQWDFTDAPAFTMHIENGESRVEQGRAESPDLRFRSTWEDFVDVSMLRLDPRRALATRRLRPSGNLRLLLRFPKLFGRTA